MTYETDLAPSPSRVRWIAFWTCVSFLGTFVHNMADLPGLTVFSPENMVPAVISLVLFLTWWRAPNRFLITFVFLAWAVLAQFLIGGILTVLPLPFLPFAPAQTPFHYSMHAVYALAQLPLMVALIMELLRVRSIRNTANAQI